MGGGIEADIGEMGEGIGEHDLLGEAEQENLQPLDDRLGARPGEGRREELRDDLARADDRAGDQVRKEGDKRRVGDEVRCRPVGARAVGQEHDLLEGEEADRERQCDGESGGMQMGKQRRRAGEEARVFEPPEQAEIEP